jgi:hypothetical protein
MTLAELRAKNAAKNKLIKKAPVVEENDDDMENNEVEEVTAPTKKVVAKKTITKKAPVVEENDDDMDVESDDDEVEEVVPTKKVAAKKAVTKTPVDEETEDEMEDNEVEEVVPTKKVTTKSTSKASTDEEVPAKKVIKWGTKTAEPEEAKVIGRQMPLSMFYDQVHERFAELGVPNKALTVKLIKEFEKCVLDIIPHHNLYLFGMNTKRSEIQARIYHPNEVLTTVSTPYSTLVEPHTKVSLSFILNKVTRKGIVAENGEFVEGMFDDDGNFIEGSWVDGEFVPAEKKAPIKKKK